MNDVRTFEERQKATFRHEPVERIVWQPRFGDWYYQNNILKLRRGMSADQVAGLVRKCPDLPEAIYGMEPWEIYDFLNASPRYTGECWGGMGFFFTKSNPDVKIEHKYTTDEKGNREHVIKTPFGNLHESWRAGSSYPDERMLKTRDDFPAVLYYIKNSYVEHYFNETMYNIYLEVNEGRCVSCGGPWRSPYNKCIVELAGTKNTMLLMKRYPQEFDDFCEELARINFEVIMPVELASPVEFMSFGDNVDGMNNPPPVYEKYILPYFQQAADMCKKAGKFTFAHYDGHLKDLLPYLSNDQFPFDGIEAPTIKPQGDVTLEEFRRALGDRIIVLDGIPSTIFLSQFTDEQFVDLVQSVLNAFSPNIILGVSDEYSPNGLFKRMQMVAGIVENFEV
ncbi:MAG TPA: hypothetical protein VKM55_05135 [Candidatus Lokiarchaeia archaeon]|nr:hypothetical protein [Candidatus Lokiarchaeia archaeon]